MFVICGRISVKEDVQSNCGQCGTPWDTIGRQGHQCGPPEDVRQTVKKSAERPSSRAAHDGAAHDPVSSQGSRASRHSFADKICKCDNYNVDALEATTKVARTLSPEEPARIASLGH